MCGQSLREWSCEPQLLHAGWTPGGGGVAVVVAPVIVIAVVVVVAVIVVAFIAVAGDELTVNGNRRNQETYNLYIN